MPKVSYAAVRRLSRYYRSLDMAEKRQVTTISSDDLAKENRQTAAQVRKDLSTFGAFGRRGLGYNVADLKRNIAKILGLNRRWNVVIVGAGNIGRALVNFDQFRTQGFDIKLIFDNDPYKIGTKVGELVVQDMKDLKKLVRSGSIDIGIICVPVNSAQKVMDLLVEAEIGIKAVLNFAPVTLAYPERIVVRNENMAIEIEALSFALTNPTMVR
jgi:redox-sensing transcriptional repressor